MVSLSLAWVVVTIVKKKDLVGFEFNPAIFVLTGGLDVFMALALASVFCCG